MVVVPVLIGALVLVDGVMPFWFEFTGAVVEPPRRFRSLLQPPSAVSVTREAVRRIAVLLLRTEPSVVDPTRV